MTIEQLKELSDRRAKIKEVGSLAVHRFPTLQDWAALLPTPSLQGPQLPSPRWLHPLGLCSLSSHQQWILSLSRWKWRGLVARPSGRGGGGVRDAGTLCRTDRLPRAGH